MPAMSFHIRNEGDLPMQSFPRGHHQRSFVLDALQSGTYFYRLTTADGLVRSHTVQVVD